MITLTRTHERLMHTYIDGFDRCPFGEGSRATLLRAAWNITTPNRVQTLLFCVI